MGFGATRVKGDDDHFGINLSLIVFVTMVDGSSSGSLCVPYLHTDCIYITSRFESPDVSYAPQPKYLT